MKATIVIHSVAIFSTLTGCSSFEVSHENKNSVEKLPGVPFYNLVGMVKQDTFYRRTWHKVSLSFKLPGKQKTPSISTNYEYNIQSTTFDIIELVNTINEHNKGFNLSKITKKIRQDLESCRGNNNCLISHDKMIEMQKPVKIDHSMLQEELISNNAIFKAIPDYSKKYYFNARAPFFGTTTAAIKLNENGTLQESSSTVDTQKLTDVIPVNKKLMDRWGLLPDVDTDAAPTAVDGIGDDLPRVISQPIYQPILSVDITGIQYKLTKYIDYSNTSTLNQSPLLFTDSMNNTEMAIEITQFKENDEKKVKPKKLNNSIMINGEITLPDEPKKK
ncbi:MAG: hypothetical protein AB2809_22250 [Candidatus Thiodiazotropha sp.]